MYVCIYIYIYVYTHTHVYIYIYMYVIYTRGTLSPLYVHITEYMINNRRMALVPARICPASMSFIIVQMSKKHALHMAAGLHTAHTHLQTRASRKSKSRVAVTQYRTSKFPLVASALSAVMLRPIRQRHAVVTGASSRGNAQHLSSSTSTYATYAFTLCY